MAKTFTLGKDERLKSRKAIAQLFESGRKVSAAPFLVYYLLHEQPASKPLRFSVGVSARNFKKAVDRNRIKRLTREAFRLQKPELQQAVAAKKNSLDLFFIYSGKELPLFDQVFSTVGRILKKINSAVT